MADQRTKIIIETDAGRSEQVLRSVQKGLQGVGNEATKAGQNVKSGAGLMDSSFAKTAISAAAVGAAIKSAFSMAKEAAQMSEARLYLQTLTAEMGVSYEKLDQISRRATSGQVDNFRLIQSNHRALKLGITKDVNEIGQLWQIADAIGDEFGESIEQTFDRLVKAISKGSKEELIQLGLLPPAFKQASDATELLANRSLLLKSVLEQAGAGASNLSKQGDTAADKFNRFEAATTNLKNSLGEALLPIITPVVEGLTAIANAAGKVIEKFAQLNDMNSKSPLLGKSLDELKQLREATAARVTSLDFEVDALSRPASQGGKAGPYTEGERQQKSILLAGEKQMLKEIEKVIADLESRTKARAEAQKVVVAETKNETTAKVQTTAAQKEYNKAQDVAAKQLETMLEMQVKSFGKAIEDGREAIQVLNAMTAAAGGFAVGLKDGVSETSKLLDKLNDINDAIAGTLSGAGKNWSAELARLNPETAATGMMNFMTGGLFSAPGESAKDAIKEIQQPLAETIAEAVQAGFANADFSDLSMTLGNILSTVISKSVSQSNPVMNAAGGINFGNLGINLATNFVLGKLTGSGGIFGGRKEKFKAETLQAAADLRSQMGAAWTKSHETSLLPYLSSSQKNDLAAARYGYYGTQTGYSWSDSGNGIWSAKTRTYNLIDQGASAALARLTEVIENAERYNRSVEMGYELQSAKGYDYSALIAQEAAYRQAAANAYGGIQTLTWTDGGKDVADLAEAAHEIKMAAAEMARSLGAATGERNTQVAQGFAQYAPWLDNMYMSGGLPSSLRANILSQITGMVGMDKLSTSQQYDAFSKIQTGYMDRNISPYLLDMVKQAGSNKYELEELRITDQTAYAEKYLEYIEKQMAAYDEVMRRQEEIFKNASKSYEERSAALAAFEQAQEGYYQTKLETLAAEQAAEEAVKAKQQEADLRRMASMESMLSLAGEVSQRGDKIVILHGGDTSKAIRELMTRYEDDPEMVATLQTLLKVADDKARWG
jgi:hypothetical protein